MKINYNDYYKFLVSLGIVCIILLFVGTIYLNHIGILPLDIKTILLFLLVFIVLMVMILSGIKPWRERQRIYDKILKLEYDTQYINFEVPTDFLSARTSWER